MIVDAKRGVHIKIDNSFGDFSFMCFTNGNFYKDQYGSLGVFKNKCKKIFAIIRNKDYHYSDIVMSKEDFQEFKNYVNQMGE